MTTRLRGLPPGRAGRTWLTRRRDVAERGADLLERKLRILLAEEQDYAMRRERSSLEWTESARALDLWMLRSAFVSGERGVRLAGDGRTADVGIEWRLTMGVRYPSGATLQIPEPSGSAFAPDNSALRLAVPAARRALRAAVDHAVAAAAHAAIVDEIATTRRQLRAVRNRWLPRLEAELAGLVLLLDEQEHDEQVRLRWAADAARGGTAGP